MPLPTDTLATEPPFRITERSVDAARPLKVICVGAGISGILMGIRIPQYLRDFELTIYDKNEELGGTWWENRYPGCACDIPAHVYQLSFEPNPEWSQFYATAPEILKYWQKVADKYDVRQYMKLSHKVLEARWDEKTSKWRVLVQNVKTGETIQDESDALILGIGVLNEWKWPNISGLHDYKGKLLHSAAWDETYDYTGQSVALIGAGSSGIQILPNIQPKVNHVDHYVRGSTWIATTIAGDQVKKRNPNGSNFDFTKEEIQAWLADPDLYHHYRKALEYELQSGHPVTMKDSIEQKEARAFMTDYMNSKLASKPDVAKHFLPNFPPTCKRLTPGPGYLEALVESNVNVISSPISHITARGIVTKDGAERSVDAIICATGFDTSFKGRFPIYGQGGVKLSDKWADYPSTYLSLATSGFPNMFMSFGPNSGVGAGNLVIIFERVAAYVAACLAKLQTQHLRSMAPSRTAERDFVDFCTSYFDRTVHSMECSSWYKGGGRGDKVTALWPGSSLHAVEALAAPRWEDFDFEYIDGQRFGWFGNGWSERDHRVDADRAWYFEPHHWNLPEVRLKKGDVLVSDLEKLGVPDSVRESKKTNGKPVPVKSNSGIKTAVEHVELGNGMTIDGIDSTGEVVPGVKVEGVPLWAAST